MNADQLVTNALFIVLIIFLLARVFRRPNRDI